MSDWVIRDYRKEDRQMMVEDHQKSGNNAILADPDHPLHVMTFVAEKDGKILAAATIRVTTEVFLNMFPAAGKPADKLQIIRDIIEYGAKRVWAQGVDEVHCGAIWKRWGQRMVKDLGFVKDPREHYVLDLAAKYRKKE